MLLRWVYSRIFLNINCYAPLVGESPNPRKLIFRWGHASASVVLHSEMFLWFPVRVEIFSFPILLPVFAIPFFFLFQHFCIFFCKFFASYTLFVLEWMLISIWNVFGFSFLNVTPENLTFGDFIHFYAFYY